ncbi:hypothetical protein [Massilia sp. CF038]|uniref:hypothetical protein n=1 Tax=Massilia sp. CF038 TaxID=1881045 RepID=UPI00091AB652|nr:hypothetical protein [Massilia sp. CF038]SHG73952.1 hypothetical protein SAMN05428948_1836 [Massilia sp. CF038]
MPKNKRPVPRKSHNPAEEEEALALRLAELALAMSEQEHTDADDETDSAAQQAELRKLLRNALRKKDDDLLYGAIEAARDTDLGAYQLLKGQIEEASATLVLRKEGTPAMEINAFAVPLFVHSQGGLRQADTFQDSEAFSALIDSFKQAGLESPQAKVVLISHAFDAEEMARISYTQLGEMVRDAAAVMTERKLVAAPALEASISGWAASPFGPHDKAVELRFLVGFAYKREDDPFYQVPADEAAADAWFEARMGRYRAWTEAASGLIQRCLRTQPGALDLHFLYQDLFFGAREQGMTELAMLQMMATLGAAIEAAGPGAQVQAVVGPADADHVMQMRVQLLGSDGAVLASADKALDLAADLQDEVDDIADALATLGVTQIAVARRFDAAGTALDATPYRQA